MNLRHDRQSFLGAESESIIRSILVGVVGLNGGGSHVVQQLGHIGVRRYALFDPQAVDTSNLNRNVLATVEDVAIERMKTDLARRRLESIAAGPLELYAVPCRWQDAPDVLRKCDIIIACVDTFQQRDELEAFARRHLIPLVDIGLGVTTVAGEPPRMGGQIIVSVPGGPCMRCLGFLTEERLAQEAEGYGDAGPRPQVVWANGVLASTAVGLTMDLFCNWTGQLGETIYYQYDGNSNTVAPHSRLEVVGKDPCPHYPLREVGEPLFQMAG